MLQAVAGGSQLGGLTGNLTATLIDAGATLDFNGVSAQIANLQGNTATTGGVRQPVVDQTLGS